jgi:hypothetical protein
MRSRSLDLCSKIAASGASTGAITHARPMLAQPYEQADVRTLADGSPPAKTS